MTAVASLPPPSSTKPHDIVPQASRWEVVCPDKVVRIEPFHTIGTAAMACTFHSRPLGYHPRRQAVANDASPSVTTRAAEVHGHAGCPGGKHTVRPVTT